MQQIQEKLERRGKMIRIKTGPVKGLTAIELLVIISFVALVAAFAAPIKNAVSPKSDFKQAIEITEASIEQARRIARFYKADVLMRLETDEKQEQQFITLTIPKMQKDLVLSEVKEEFPLPTGIQVVSDGTIIRFDPNGEVQLPAHVLVFSDLAQGKSRRLVIK
jgi:Tfp pilus assembly protein FimT